MLTSLLRKYSPFVEGIRCNLKGNVRLRGKYLIIESDDWGGIRTPSNEALLAFKKRGFELYKYTYQNDALASKKDLEELFGLLLGIKNGDGKSPVITANAIMANPDFKRIRDSDFKVYFYEPFTETFKRYPEHKDNLRIWKEGIESGIFYPQFHGREHLNIRSWLKALQKPDDKVRYSFDWESTYSGIGNYAFMEAFDWESTEEVNEHIDIIHDGLRIFNQAFGYRAKTFMAPCYTWHPKLEQALADNGIEWIQSARNQLVRDNETDSYNRVAHYFSEKNCYNSRFNIRNVFFEPFDKRFKDWSNKAFYGVYLAFLMGRPAVISTHRINYVGYIDPKNRDNGLTQLRKLLRKIVNKWPDVKFISTDQLSNCT